MKNGDKALGTIVWTIVKITAFHTMTDGENGTIVKDACKIWNGANTFQRASVWRF